VTRKVFVTVFYDCVNKLLHFNKLKHLAWIDWFSFH